MVSELEMKIDCCRRSWLLDGKLFEFVADRVAVGPIQDIETPAE